MMIRTDDFIEMLGPDKTNERVVRYGRIDHFYTSGLPQIVFDGEEEPSVKQYPHLESYTPQANDRVMLIKNVIVGKIVS